MSTYSSPAREAPGEQVGDTSFHRAHLLVEDSCEVCVPGHMKLVPNPN